MQVYIMIVHLLECGADVLFLELGPVRGFAPSFDQHHLLLLCVGSLLAL